MKFARHCLSLVCTAVVAVGAWAAPAAEQDHYPLQIASAAKAPVPAASEDRLRPFDAQDYVLAFDALLGVGDLQRAFEVAQKAVQSVPKDRAWRLRLAKVSQWTQRPQVMAEQWLALFQQGDHSSDTVARVIELAPLADQPSVALQAWAVYARQRNLTDQQWTDVLSLYESAAEPAPGSLFFEEQFAKTRNPLLLDYAARLAEHGGDDVRAEALYARRAALEPFSMDSLLRAVVNQVRRAQLREALTLMQAHESRVPANALEYWQMLSQVAWELREYDVSRQGYTRYTRLPQAVAADWSRLIFLVRRDHPAQAADLAIEAYQRFGQDDQLLYGLGIYADLGDMAAQARVFAGLGDAAKRLAAKVPRFLLLRAQFHQKQNNASAAWNDLQHAVSLAPDDADVLLACVWFLIDSHRIEDLAQFLRTKASVAQGQPTLWSGFAAASQLLERHRDAVRWYEKIVRAKTDDPLTLLNYADARERLGQSGMADRLRRHAWLQLQARYPDPNTLRTLAKNQELLAFARLSLLNQPGDPGQALARQLVAQLRGISDAAPDSQVLALILGWAIVKEQFPNARSWMWRRYVQQSGTQAPLWGQAQVALQLNDRPTMQRLLANSAALPIYNRYDIAYSLGHRQQAFDIAFKGQLPQDDEPLHDRYRQHVPQVANYLQIETQAENGSDLAGQGQRFDLRLAIRPGVALLLAGSAQKASFKEPLVSTLSPGSDRLCSAEVQWTRPNGNSSVALYRHNASASWTGVHLGHTLQWDSRFSLDTTVDYHASSLVSQAMRWAGYEDSISTSISFALGKREALRVTPQASRYYTQFGDALGSSQSLEVEASHRIRTEYPDLRVRAFIKGQQFDRLNTLGDEALARLPADVRMAAATRALNPIAYFLPESSTRAGVCADMGENLAGQNMQLTYTRAWRPFVNACVSHDTVAGPGFSGTLGIAGSITGEDHVRLQWESTQAVAPGRASANTLTLRYRHYF